MTGERSRAGTRNALAVLIAVTAGLTWAFLAAITPPLAIGCDPAIPREICEDTADAGLRRGMPNLRPLIVRADVAPGPAWPDGAGHKATVVYSMLPGPAVTERIYYDAGSHWGVEADRGNVELALWSLVPTVLAGMVAAVVPAVRRRRSPG